MCDSLVALGAETPGGFTLFGKNSDRKDGECQPFLQFPAAAYPPGAKLRCTHIEIPQVAETYRVMGHSPWWVWGFEHGVNEHQVAIGNQTVFSKEPVEETPGLIGMDLVRVGLERGRNARESLEVIAMLLETHGQGGPALEPGGAGYHNSFLLADPQESWMLETSGRHWAARKTSRDAMSNHMALGEDWEIASRDLETFARAEGFWSEADQRIDVARAYRNPHVPGRISEGRLRRSRELLSRYSGQMDVAKMKSILRDHLGDAAWVPGPTPDDEAFFTLCAHSAPVHTTTASLVTALYNHGPIWVNWISFGTPCTGIFLPIYMDGVIPPVLAQGDSEKREDSAWWTFKALQDAAARNFPLHTPRIRERWSQWAIAIETGRQEAEREAALAEVRGRGDEASERLTKFMADTTASALETARELTAELESAA